MHLPGFYRSLLGGSLLFFSVIPARSAPLFGAGFSSQPLNIQNQAQSVSEALKITPLSTTITQVSEIVVDPSFVNLVSVYREPQFSTGRFSLPSLKRLLKDPLGAIKPRRTFKPGSCYFSFLENCIKGPYISAGYVSSSSLLTVDSPYSRSSSYVSNGSNYLVDTSYNISSTSSASGSGGEVGLGYDHGGIRNELSISILSSVQNLAVENGFDDITTGGRTTRLPYGIALNSGIPGSTPAGPVSANVSRKSLLAKTSIDIPTSTRFVPYLGFGLGVSLVDVSPVSWSTGLDVCTALDWANGVPGTFAPCPVVFAPSGGTATLFLGQLHAGISYMVSPRFSIYVQAAYDYSTSGMAGDIELPTSTSYSGSSGIRFKL